MLLTRPAPVEGWPDLISRQPGCLGWRLELSRLPNTPTFANSTEIAIPLQKYNAYGINETTMALQVGTKRRARSHLLRVNACGKLQCIVVGFVVLWFAYLSGVIFMAIGVHKLDELGSANPAKDGGGSIQAPPHRIQMKSKVDAHQATPATPTAKPTAKAVVANNTASAAPKPAAVQKPDPEREKTNRK